SSDYQNVAFPPAGTRVQPSDAPHLGVIQANSPAPAIQGAPGAGYWRLVGLELTRPTDGSAAFFGPLFMGIGATGPSEISHHIICDRCYIHRRSNDNSEMTTGVLMDGNYLAVIDSYISNIGVQEDQAISNCNGNGPLKVVNTYLEASGENLLLGGCDPSWIGSYPQDVEIRNDYFAKQLAWKSLPPATPTTVKNLLELKIGQRVLVQDSILEYNWINGQGGTAILITP